MLADGSGVVDQARAEEYLPGARRWLTSVVTSDPAGVIADLRATGLTDPG
ncbi:hypothetical protein [Nocardioides daphniae]|nr:hypothetical protein [Nocardioides daphniae]